MKITTMIAVFLVSEACIIGYASTMLERKTPDYSPMQERQRECESSGGKWTITTHSSLPTSGMPFGIPSASYDCIPKK